MSNISLAEFADKVDEIMPVIAREFLKQKVDNLFKVRLTMPQMIVLNMLDRHGESKMTDLAHFINVTTAAMTGVVDRLVRDGYVRRASDPKDRRIIRTALTAKGKRLVDDIAKERKRMMVKVFGMISQAEREAYLNILTHIQEHLKEPEGNRRSLK